MDARFAQELLRTRTGGRSRGLAVVSAFAIGTLAACSGGSAPHDGSSGGVRATATTTASGDVAPAASNGVPLAVTRVGTLAEEGYDAVRTAKWSAAAALADSLELATPGLPSSPAAQGFIAAELREAVASFGGTLRTRDRIGGMRATNRITYLAAQLGAPYRTGTPTEVLLMDSYGRDLEIGAATHDAGALQRTAGDISQAWRTLRTAVEANGGAAEAARFDALVMRVREARSPAESAKLATAFLDEVDKVALLLTRR